MSDSQLIAEIVSLRAENARLTGQSKEGCVAVESVFLNQECPSCGFPNEPGEGERRSRR